MTKEQKITSLQKLVQALNERDKFRQWSYDPDHLSGLLWETEMTATEFVYFPQLFCDREIMEMLLKKEQDCLNNYCNHVGHGRADLIAGTCLMFLYNDLPEKALELLLTNLK